MKINKRERTLVLATLLLAVGVLGYYLAIAPLVRRHRELTTRAAQLEGEWTRYQRSLRQRGQIEDRYRQMAVDLRQTRSNEEEIALLLQDLLGKSSKLSLTHKGTKVLPVEETPFYRKFRVSMELEGSALALADFMHSITTAAEPLKIEQLHLRSAADAASRVESVRGSIVVSAVHTSSAPAGAQEKSGQ